VFGLGLFPGAAMSTPTRQTERRRASRKQSAVEAGLPDPRPVTGFSVALSTVGPNTRITITLAQPCVVRSPRWRLVSSENGALTTLPAPTVVDSTTFYYDVPGALNPAVGFIDVPYMDTQVQNFQGGFVKPGGTWFRAAFGP
jgi:hypothetical protein